MINPPRLARERQSQVYIYICVRLLRVVRLTAMGNSRASTREMGNKYGSHAFFIIK